MRPISAVSLHSTNRRFALLMALLTATTALLWQLPARAETPDVVELFTSHGCSSCPSADRLLAELIEQNPALVALEFHVDYWNELIHGSDGNWVDPFSNAANTDRQRAYNQMSLDGRAGVYTPQMIINGEFATVGSDRRSVLAQLGKRQAVVAVTAKAVENQLQIKLSNPSKLASQVWLVTFDRFKNTDITAGENRHLSIENHHIVKSLRPLEKIDTAEAAITVPLTLAKGEGCAVLVQSELMQPILGATLCPL